MEMSWLILLIAVMGLWVLFRQVWPLPYLTHINYQSLISQKNHLNGFKILDIRDAYEYRIEPTDDSINISLGRLPYVWHKHLLRDEKIFILSHGVFKARKAARILRKRGFKYLYVVEQH